MKVWDGSQWVDTDDAGKVLQVVSTTKTDTFSASTSGGTFTDITGLSATITPSATSSKILVLYDVAGADGNNSILEFSIRVARDGTAIGVGDVAGNRVSANAGVYISSATGADITKVSGSILDSPNSTSSLTYQVQGTYPNANPYTLFINRTRDDGNTASYHRTASTITLMEIAG